MQYQLLRLRATLSSTKLSWWSLIQRFANHPSLAKKVTWTNRTSCTIVTCDRSSDLTQFTVNIPRVNSLSWTENHSGKKQIKGSLFVTHRCSIKFGVLERISSPIAIVCLLLERWNHAFDERNNFILRLINISGSPSPRNKNANTFNKGFGPISVLPRYWYCSRDGPILVSGQ